MSTIGRTTQAVSFPHSCIYCEKYYPRNDNGDATRGGGECWSWSGIRGGDRAVNKCDGFSPAGTVILYRRSMYSVKAMADGDHFKLSFEDDFLHVVFFSVEESTMDEAVSAMESSLSEWCVYFRSLASMFPATAMPRALLYSLGDHESMTNPHSIARRRFNTVLKGHPRNVQLSYRFSSSHGTKLVRLRIYNGDLGIGILADDAQEFVPIAEYDGSFRDEFLALLSGEFRDFSKFMALYRDGFKRR